MFSKGKWSTVELQTLNAIMMDYEKPEDSVDEITSDLQNAGVLRSKMQIKAKIKQVPVTKITPSPLSGNNNYFYFYFYFNLLCIGQSAQALQVANFLAKKRQIQDT